MKILAIETSCDETAISIVEAKGGFEKPQFKILAETVISQVNLHKKYGGVFPALARREHTKNLLPVLITTLEKSENSNSYSNSAKNTLNQEIKNTVTKMMRRESELADDLIKFVEKNKAPKIDAVAVTFGPGLEPALWTGLNFAKALSLLWNKPLIPTNHMEGHLLSFLANEPKNKTKVKFPALGLLLSGGHTELVLMKDWFKFKTVGQTRDDAVGEAYDKVARMLGLSYPGGPIISKMAEECKTNKENFSLPRPMINTADLDFSFSGLKTAVLYTTKEITKMTPSAKKELSKEFQNAVIDVLLKKTKKALEKYKIKTLILGGGVTASEKIRKEFKDIENDELTVLMPEVSHTGDNATMIAIAGYFRYLKGKVLEPQKVIKVKADGNLRL